MAIHFSSQLPFNLNATLERVAKWLPAQAPIKDFIHHNTLHNLEDLEFHEAIAVASKVYGARSYLPIAQYQQRYEEGRISDRALRWAVNQIEDQGERHDTLLMDLFRKDHSGHFPPVSLAMHGLRQKWLTHIEVNLDEHVSLILIRLVANYLDQGLGRLSVARDGESLWACLQRLAQKSLIPLQPFDDPKAKELLSNTPEQVIEICLARIVGSEALFEQYLLEMLLIHPGWSGMVHVIEHHPEHLLIPRAISLKEFVAVRLVMELGFLHKQQGSNFLSVADVPKIEAVLDLKSLVADRRAPSVLRVWQEAMEYSLHAELLDALHVLRHSESPQVEASIPDIQALFCIDDRECSLRRHLEEINSAVETFGAPGFFGIDFYYQGIDDAYPVAQCPVIVKPKHLIRESDPASHPKKAKIRTNQFQHASLISGWLHTQTLGLSYIAHMLWDVFRPGSKFLGIQRLGEVKAHGHLHLLRETDDLTPDGRLLGFSHHEMADKLELLFRSIGLVHFYAPLVVIVAHGSSSVNNPHFAAYDCGACSGKPGAPNARAFALMANDPKVRRILSERNIKIPESTRFVASLHNTSRDDMSYFDDEDLVGAHRVNLNAFKRMMAKALERNACERSRWFELKPNTKNQAVIHNHVRGRSESIFEPRPELNHSNNAFCVVGRRSLTSALFLDRRAFLQSYDPFTDEEGDVLFRVLSAVIPVCGGINLEYFFSRMDNEVYGAGTKLPHNVIGLIGVSNGVSGDLRTGLPSQMIEVHDPVRLLIVVEQQQALIDRVILRLGGFRKMLENDWVKLASCDPTSGKILMFSAEGWTDYEPSYLNDVPRAKDSVELLKRPTKSIPVHILENRLSGGPLI